MPPWFFAAVPPDPDRLAVLLKPLVTIERLRSIAGAGGGHSFERNLDALTLFHCGRGDNLEMAGCLDEALCHACTFPPTSEKHLIEAVFSVFLLIRHGPGASQRLPNPWHLEQLLRLTPCFPDDFSKAVLSLISWSLIRSAPNDENYLHWTDLLLWRLLQEPAPLSKAQLQELLHWHQTAVDSLDEHGFCPPLPYRNPSERPPWTTLFLKSEEDLRQAEEWERAAWFERLFGSSFGPSATQCHAERQPGAESEV